jgi:hypothetical protein
MNNIEEKSIPVCFSSEELKVIEGYAKRKGMLDHVQAIEHIIKKL